MQKITSAASLKSSAVRACLILFVLAWCMTGGIDGMQEASATLPSAITSCGDCHDYPPLDGVSRNTPTGAVVGSHQKHASTATGNYWYDCTVCHVNNTAYNHRNWNIEMVSPLNAHSGSYNNPSGNTFVQTNSPTLYNCSTTYCHSTGTGATLQSGDGRPVAANTSPVWGNNGTIACNSCHGKESGNDGTGRPHYTGGSPKTNSHESAKHVSLSCDKCHNATTTTGTSITDTAMHANRTYNVVGTGSVPYTFTYAYDANGGACSTGYCHGTSASSPAWGGGTTCASCHGASNNGDLSVGSTVGHGIHYATATTATSLTQSDDFTGGYAFGCGNCHPSTTHSSGPVNTGVQDAEIKVTGKISAYTPGTSASDAKGYKYTSGSCTTVCHTRDGVNGAPIAAPVWNGAKTSPNCGVCHNKAGDASPAWSTPHTRHINTYGVSGSNPLMSCNACHSGTATNNTTINGATGRAQHPNTNRDLAFNATVGGTASGAQGAQQCSNTYCHSPGTAASGVHAAISWSGTMNAECSSCHGGNATTTLGQGKITTNAHNAHITSAGVGRNIGCAECHSATVSADRTISNMSTHVSKTVNVRFDGGTTNPDSDNPTYNNVDARSTATNGSSNAPGATKGACNNLYCHSSGNLSNVTSGTGTIVVSGSTPTFKSITWDTSTIGCEGCHGNGTDKAHPGYTTGAAGSTTANSHVKHVENGGLGCVYCHNLTTSGTGTTSASLSLLTGATSSHLNRKEDVSFMLNGGKTGTYNGTVGQKTCSATYCHGTGPSVGWGGGTNCNSCHQSQGADGTANFTGKHQKHVDTTGYNFSCEACHAVASTTHAGGPATGTNPGGGAVGASQTTEIQYTALSAGTMLTGQNYRGSLSTYKYMAVTNNPYLGSSVTTTYAAGTATGVDSLNTAITFYTNGSCNGLWCHSNANPSGGLNSYATPTWGATLNCGSCHNKQGDASPTWSAPHSKHVNAYSVNANFTCTACHNGTASDNLTISTVSSHVNGTKNVSFSTYANSAATNNLGTHQCSNVYCHGDGTTATPTVATTWSGNLTCAGCHQNTAALLTSGSHSYHIQYSSITCDDCHNLTAAAGANNALSSSTGTSNHVNKSVTIQFNAASANNLATYNSISSGGSYSYQKGIASTKGTCNVTYCHGSNSGTWGVNTGNATCTKCHGLVSTTTASYTADPNRAAPGYVVTGTTVTGVDTNGDTLASDGQVGAHNAHLTTSAYRGPIACTSCHVVPNAVGDTGHFDNALPADITFSGLSATYHSVSAPSPTYNSSTKTCSATYCHDGAYIKNGSTWSNGTGVAPVWTNTAYLNATPTAADCGKCHGYPPAGTHDNPAPNCSQCHNNVRSSDNLGFTAGGLSQHMDGQLLGGGDACLDCHGALTSGLHSKHTTTSYLVSKSLTSLDYGKGSWWYSYNYTSGVAAASCGYCHPSTLATHRNGSRNLNFLNTDSTNTYYAGTVRAKNGATELYTQTSGTSVTCSSVYCHSNGYGTFTYATTPDWYGGAFVGDKCQACHGNWPNDSGQKAGSPAHTGHAVGIHFKDIFTNTTGTMATGTGTANSHGNALYSTTINCNICHNGTVTVSQNMNGTQCSSCHAAGANAIVMTISTTSTLHVNGAIDVAFNAVSVKSKAQLRDDITTVAELNNNWTRTGGYKAAGAYDAAKNALNTGTMWNGGSKTCSNIACHNGNSVTWSTTMTCGSCHTELP